MRLLDDERLETNQDGSPSDRFEEFRVEYVPGIVEHRDKN